MIKKKVLLDNWIIVTKWVLLSLPALWTGILMYRFGVDIPYWDQWDGICPLFEKLEIGQLRIADFFAQHSEHRIFFPRILIYTLARLTDWNIRWELLMMWVLACVTLGNFALITQETLRKPTNFWLLLGASVLLFSPLQWENWLWGFQLGLVMPITAFTASLWTTRLLRIPAAFLSTIALCTVITFSGASGFASWLLCTPLLLFPEGRLVWRDRIGWWILWVAVAVGSFLLYFHNYQRPSYHPDPFFVLSHPLDGICYILAFIGGPFAMGTDLNPMLVSNFAGGLLLLCFCACLCFLWQQRANAEFVKKALPWIVLCAFALMNAFAAMIGRLGFGAGQALSSRYVTFAVLFSIGLLFFAAQVLDFIRRDSPKAALLLTRVRPCLVTAYALLLLLGGVTITQVYRDVKRSRLWQKAVVQSVNQVDEPELMAGLVHVHTGPLKARINVLDRFGYLRPPLLRSNNMREITQAPSADQAGNGELQRAGNAADGRLVVGGWAFLPDRQRPADAVMLAYDDPSGAPTLFALALVGSATPDISKSHNGNSIYLLTGWEKVFNKSVLPVGVKVIRAYAYDAESAKAYMLLGVLNLAD